MPDIDVMPAVVTEEQVVQPELFEDDFADYQKAKLRIDRLIADFQNEISKTQRNREERFKELDIPSLKEKGILKENQFMIPVRVIDSNIRREQPAFRNYMTQSRRLMIFKDIIDPGMPTGRLEEEYTRGMQYSGWDIPYFKEVDGSQTHGWDSVEVVFDISKPLHVAIEHIGHDRLIFPLDAIDIQNCELVIRHYSVSPQQLRVFARDFGFSAQQIKTVLDKALQDKKEKCVEVYKCFWKKEGVVYYAWYGRDCSDWMKAPAELYLGISSVQQMPVVDPVTGQNAVDPTTGTPMTEEKEVDEPVALYPIFILPYYATEQARIIDHKGRVFLDKHKQEAQTANLSQFLNGCQLASGIYPSLAGETFKNASSIQSIQIKEYEIPPVPVSYTQFNYPDAVMLSLQQYMDTANSQEVGQVNYAVQNRKDSRKTATEVASAEGETSMLKSVQTSLYSSHIRDVNTLSWRIVQSQAMAGKITFLADPVSGENQVEIISRQYDLRAAGDVDVIKRQELIMQYKEFWPIIQSTPAAMTFLARLLELVFTDEGQKYADIIEAGDPRAVLLQLTQILEATLTPDEVAGIPPEQRMVLMQVLEQAKAISEQYMLEQVEKNPALKEKLHNQPAPVREVGTGGLGEDKQQMGEKENGSKETTDK